MSGLINSQAWRLKVLALLFPENTPKGILSQNPGL